MEPPEIIVTTTDLERLQHLLDGSTSSRDRQYVEYLDLELARARVVPPAEVPPNVVTMGSHFRYRDMGSGELHNVTLVYPENADANCGRVSVLAPVGCALLGLSVGQIIDWPLPGGRKRSLSVVEILNQPQPAGGTQRS